MPPFSPEKMGEKSAGAKPLDPAEVGGDLRSMRVMLSIVPAALHRQAVHGAPTGLARGNVRGDPQRKAKKRKGIDPWQDNRLRTVPILWSGDSSWFLPIFRFPPNVEKLRWHPRAFPTTLTVGFQVDTFPVFPSFAVKFPFVYLCINIHVCMGPAWMKKSRTVGPSGIFLHRMWVIC